MSKALSVDLRERVLAAIDAGMSGRQAAARFKVSPASVSRWRSLVRENGSAEPAALGGDRRSQHIEAHAGLILQLVAETPGQTIEELRAGLAERGVAVGYGGLWRFFARHAITLRKRPPTPPSRIGPTS